MRMRLFSGMNISGGDNGTTLGITPKPLTCTLHHAPGTPGLQCPAQVTYPAPLGRELQCILGAEFKFGVSLPVHPALSHRPVGAGGRGGSWLSTGSGT